MKKNGVTPTMLTALRCVAAAAIALTLTQCSNSRQSTATEQNSLEPRPSTTDVTTYHYDNARSGVQDLETVLTPANVNVKSFGKLFSWPVDGQVYAQPLVVGGILTPKDGKMHTLVFVATEHDSVYAFDAGAFSTTPVWMVSLLQSGETTVPYLDTQTGDIMPEIGITGTPVIDTGKGILYVVSKTKSVVNGQVTYTQRLHALSLQSGQEMLNGPRAIAPTMKGSAPDAVNGSVEFNALRENQRSALALINGMVWIAWASHGDNQPYHGWLVGYHGDDLTKAPAIFLDTPQGSEGGIWMGGSGPSADAAGNIFVNSGNGDYDSTLGNFSSSTLQIQLDGSGQPSVAGSFTPPNQAALSAVDADYGIMGAVLIPDQTGALPHLLVTGAKDGTIYVLNRDLLSKSSADSAVQTFTVSPHLHQNAIFFSGALYVSGDGTPMSAYTLDPKTSVFSTTPASSTPQTFQCVPTACYVSGSAPSISANGTQNAILWTNDTSNYPSGGPAVLRAYDSANLATELYDSNQSPGNHDQAAPAVKFTTPVVSKGQVFVGGDGAVDVYGLRSQ